MTETKLREQIEDILYDDGESEWNYALNTHFTESKLQRITDFIEQREAEAVEKVRKGLRGSDLSCPSMVVGTKRVDMFRRDEVFALLDRLAEGEKYGNKKS